MARSSDANVVIDSQEPHSHELNAPIFIKCSEVSYESNRKKFVDFNRTEDKGFVCSGVSIDRMICHILFSKVVVVVVNDMMLHLTHYKYVIYKHNTGSHIPLDPKTFVTVS